jgi:hypothetical protein
VVAAMTPPNQPSLPPRQLLLIYFCAALCLIAVAAEHQLTPFAIIGQLVLLAVVGRFRGRGLVLVAMLAVIVYVLIAGREFWLTQLSLITGADDSGNAIEAGVAQRLTGDTGQVAVKLLRIIVPGCTWLLAIAGAWVYWRRRRDLVPIALAAVPMGMAAVQSYGGELILRIVLYGLPILAILGADALRALVRWKRSMEYVLAVGMALLFGSIILIRGGNESYMIVYPDEVEMVRQVYATTPPGQEVMPLINVGPYAVEGIDTYDRGESIEDCTQLADDPIRCIEEQAPDVLLSFDSVEAQGRDLDLKPPGWSLEVVQQLVASGQYVITYQNGFDVVLRKVTPELPAEPAPGAPADAPAGGG